MKKGQISEGYVEKIQFPNKGIVTIEGQRIIIKNALPGQKIRFMLTKKRSGTCEGKLLEVLEQSPSEKKSGVCPHFGSCGGCPVSYTHLVKCLGLSLKLSKTEATLFRLVQKEAIDEAVKEQEKMGKEHKEDDI